MSKGRRWRVEHCDFRDLTVAERSVDAIVCDPPYTDDTIPIFSDLSEFAARVLKPGRLLAAYCGKLRHPEEMARLAEHLEYVWIGATVLRGRHTKVHVHKINGWHRPWLLYSAGRYKPRAWIKDTLIASEGAGEKELDDHPWQQVEGPIRELVRMLTPRRGRAGPVRRQWDHCGGGRCRGTAIRWMRHRPRRSGDDIGTARSREARSSELMDRVQARCRKCGLEFSTAAQTRTTCPGCKAAVTVRRYRDDALYGDEGVEISAGSGWATGITALVGLALVIFGIFKGPGSDPSD